MPTPKHILFFILIFYLLFFLLPAKAQSNFDPSFIISDPELQDYHSWDQTDVQNFLDAKGSYLRTAIFNDVSGTPKTAANIISDAADRYQINPKFLLVTLQKEQNLVTDDSPSERQLDWATGYGVCDGCDINDPQVQKFKGFGKQVDSSAGLMRWYYQNENTSYVKQISTPIRIDDQTVTPSSWATAFLYTYTPHLHGNENFWRIWNTWFAALYPNGTLLQTIGANDYWLIDNGQRRHFVGKIPLITRYNPNLALMVDPIDLLNYQEGPAITFPNYSLLRSGPTTYFLDYDTLRPFASDAVIQAIGFAPDEIVDVSAADLVGYTIGSTITASTTNPSGAVFKITDAKDTYYVLKDNELYPVIDPAVVTVNYRHLPVEKHQLKDIKKYQIADTPLIFNDGTLLRVFDSNIIYVIDRGKKRPIADDDTFLALGYKKTNIIPVSQLTAMNIPTGEGLFVNNSLTSAKNKYLGDNATSVPDLYGKATAASYLVAEYPSGRIISGKNIDTREPITSFAQLMTIYEALHEDFKLNKVTTYTSSTPCTNKTLLFKAGDKIKNKDLLFATLVGSVSCTADMTANDVNADQFNFINNANRLLEDWGADYSTIADASGLSSKNKSTARDILKIFTKTLENSTIKAALSTPSYNFTIQTAKGKSVRMNLKNTNQIITNIPLSKRSYNIIATKTGIATENTGAIVVLIKTKKTKKQYVVVTLGAISAKKHFDEAHNIAEWISNNKVKSTN